MRLLVQCSLLILAAWARGATKIVEGRLEAAPETGAWVVRVGTETVPMEPDRKTRFWHDRAAGDAKAFHVGDLVIARISPVETPAALREIADKASWAWLDAIRKGVREGTVKGFDGKRLPVAFPDRTEMPYRATEKSKVTLAGKEATLGDLKAGQKLWLKGRTLPTLDVWLVQASDRPLVAPPKKTATKGAKGGGRLSRKLPKLPASGVLDVEVTELFLAMGLFDVVTADGVRLHITYGAATAFFRGPIRATPSMLAVGARVAIAYRRDAYGRIVATRVEVR